MLYTDSNTTNLVVKYVFMKLPKNSVIDLAYVADPNTGGITRNIVDNRALFIANIAIGTVMELFEFYEWRYAWLTADLNAKPLLLIS